MENMFEDFSGYFPIESPALTGDAFVPEEFRNETGMFVLCEVLLSRDYF